MNQPESVEHHVSHSKNRCLRAEKTIAGLSAYTSDGRKGKRARPLVLPGLGIGREFFGRAENQGRVCFKPKNTRAADG